MLYKRKENMLDKLLRNRSFTILLTAPLVILALYILLFPTDSLQRLNRNAGTGEKYAIVFDAGSTGSRVHVYKFSRSGGRLVLLQDTFEQIKPGLGDKGWASEPEKSAGSLKPLLDTAIAAVPVSQQAETPVELRATAGLRMLPDGAADRILEAVTKILENSPFRLVPNGVSVLDGVDEGAFAWLTLNYLLGKTGKSAQQLVGAIDLGGGSVQQAFAMDPATASGAPEGYVRKMTGGGTVYDVYVHSYLGYGLMQGRGKVLTTEGSSFCLNSGVSGTYKNTYGNDEVPLKAAETGGDASECEKAVQQALRLSVDCGSDAEFCSFDGAWGGATSHGDRHFYVSSYFFDRAIESGIVSDPKALSAEVTAGAFMEAAQKACGLQASEVKASFPEVNDENTRYLCLDLSFQHALLTSGMKIGEDQKITLVRKVEYRGEFYEAAWALGAAIHTLESL